MIRRLGLPLAFFVVVSVLIEIAGRAYLAHGGMPWTGRISTYINDDTLGYRPNPGFSLGILRFNSQGYRGQREFGPRRDGAFRILSVGGSTAFGHGAPEAATYAARVEDCLVTRLGEGVVVNAGVNGWSLFQVRHKLPTWLADLQPDVVLINSSWNTGLEPYKYYRNEHLPTYPLFQYSLLFRKLDRQLRRIGLSLHYHSFLGTRQEMLGRQQHINGDPAIFHQYREDAIAVAEICRRGGAAAVFFVPPGLLPLGMDDSDAHEFLQPTRFSKSVTSYASTTIAMQRTRDLSVQQLQSVTAAATASLLDLRHVFDGMSGSERALLFRDETHLSESGHAAISQYLCDNLAPRLKLAGRGSDTR